VVLVIVEVSTTGVEEVVIALAEELPIALALPMPLAGAVELLSVIGLLALAAGEDSDEVELPVPPMGIDAEDDVPAELAVPDAAELLSLAEEAEAEDGLPTLPAGIEADELEITLTTLLDEVPIVTVKDQLWVMVVKTVEVLAVGPLEAPPVD